MLLKRSRNPLVGNGKEKKCAYMSGGDHKTGADQNGRAERPEVVVLGPFAGWPLGLVATESQVKRCSPGQVGRSDDGAILNAVLRRAPEFLLIVLGRVDVVALTHSIDLGD